MSEFKPVRSFESQIAEVFAYFNFRRVLKTMLALKWKYKDKDDSGYIPEIDQLIDRAQEYVLLCVDEYKKTGKAYGTGSGGFNASVDDQGYLSLSFNVEEWSCE